MRGKDALPQTIDTGQSLGAGSYSRPDGVVRTAYTRVSPFCGAPSTRASSTLAEGTARPRGPGETFFKNRVGRPDDSS